MSFASPPLQMVARKPHRCSWCNQAIAAGETYWRWYSVDDSGCTNKMHAECREACLQECRETGDWDYATGENERPPSPAVLEFESWDCRLLFGPLKPDSAAWSAQCAAILSSPDVGLPSIYIQAIKYTRGFFGCTLVDGKARVDALRQSLAVAQRVEQTV